MIYSYIKDIPKENLFNYLAIGVLIVSFVYYIVKPNLLAVIAVIVSGLIIWFLNDHRITEITDFNTDLELKLNSLPETKHLYIDPDLINIFYNIREFRDFNKTAYDFTVQATDNFMKIYRDIVELGTIRCVDNLEVAEEQYKLAMNNLQSIVVTIPPAEVTIKKYQDCLEIFQLIMRRHIDTMAKKCKDSSSNRRVNIRDRFYDNTTPKSNDLSDINYSNQFNFY